MQGFNTCTSCLNSNSAQECGVENTVRQLWLMKTSLLNTHTLATSKLIIVEQTCYTISYYIHAATMQHLIELLSMWWGSTSNSMHASLSLCILLYRGSSASSVSLSARSTLSRWKHVICCFLYTVRSILIINYHCLHSVSAMAHRLHRSASLKVLCYDYTYYFFALMQAIHYEKVFRYTELN